MIKGKSCLQKVFCKMIQNDKKRQIPPNLEKKIFQFFFPTLMNFLGLLMNLERKRKVIFGFSKVCSTHILALRISSALCEAKFCKLHFFVKIPGTLLNFLRTFLNPGKKKQFIYRFSMKNTTYILALKFSSSIHTFPLKVCLRLVCIS